MNRAPITNGHAAESVRARGGYDAFFTQSEDQAKATADAATTVSRPSTPNYTNLSEGPPPPPTKQPPRPVVGSPGDSGGPRHVSAPRPDQPNLQARRQTTAPAPETPVSSASARGAELSHTAHVPAPARNIPPAAAASRVVRESAEPAHADRMPERIDRPAVESVRRVEVLPPALASVELLADIAAVRRAQLLSNTGMRGALNKVGFRLGLSPAEQRTEDRRSRIRRQLTTTYQIAVVSVKGGVGRTTTVAALGSTFSSMRPDRVVAIDANPDFGDLATRTNRHPYGLTLRDLARAPHLDAFSAVQSYTSINTSDLAVVASPWTTEADEALTGSEYMTAVEVLRRHYNLLIVDCGTGVLDSSTSTVLQTSDAVVVVTPATVGGVTGAVATLNWLSSHGLLHLVAASTVAIVHHQPTKPTVDVGAIENLFATAQRPTCTLPYDAHLAEGGEIDLRLLDKETLLAFEELAAGIADGFPCYFAGDAGDYGAWR